VEKLASGEEVVAAELTGRRLDGSLVPVAMSVRRVVDEEGPVHEGVLVDLTDRKRAEEAATLRSVAELANAAAHRINNPLSVIVGDLELMVHGHATPERLARARAAAESIREIVADMLRITRVASARGAPDVPPMLDLGGSGEGGPTT
jgi:signal transduction histidine kinase